MARRFDDQWDRLFAQKKQDFLESDCQQAMNVASFEDLTVSLHEMASKYQSGGFPDFINKLNPSLEHVASFSRAISSATQAAAPATLMWGAIQAIMESACQNKYAVDEMLSVVETLATTLPILDQHADLFARSQKLQFKLQDLYDTYMNFCIASVQYINRSGAANFVLYFFNPSPQKLVITTKAKLMEQTKDLKRALAEVKGFEDQHLAIHTALTTNPLSDLATEPSAGLDDDLAFPVSTVTYHRNYTFIGQDAVLAEMYKLFTSGDRQLAQSNQFTAVKQNYGHDPSCFILQGLGGIGKSQIALEYSYRHREDYHAIFWVRADSNYALAPAFADITEKLQLDKDLGDTNGQEQGRATERANVWLRKSRKRWLLIFDNVEDMSDLNPYFPTDVLGTGHVIITTQKSDLFPMTNPAVTRTHKVANLDRSEGALIIFKYLQRSPSDEAEEEHARSISDLVGGLPLALATIGGYLNQTESSVSDYYKILKTSSKAWESDAIGPAKQYGKSLEVVFDHALGELPEGARSLINMLAFLDPDRIPEEMFKKNIGTDVLPFLSSEAEYIDLIKTLRKRQLISRNTAGRDPFLSIHRTVQWSILLNLSKKHDYRMAEFQKTFKLLQTCLPVTSSIDNPEPENLALYDRYVPQLLNVRSHCLWPEPPLDLPIDFAQVLDDVATYMWQIGMLSQGQEAMYTAEHILERCHVERTHPLRTRLHEHIGIIASYYGVTQRDEALERRQKAIRGRLLEFDAIPVEERTLHDKIRRWNVESDMAFGHLQWENFEECEQQWDRCIEQYKKMGTEETIPFEYLKYNHGISYVRMAQGKPVEAIRHAKKSAELAEKCAGLMHPTTYLCRFTLTHLLYLAGELDEALKESEVVVTARSRICGEFNASTLDAYAFHASLLAENGDYEKAEAIYLRCLDRRKWSFWNPEGIARTQYLYGQTLEQLGKIGEANTQYARARDTKDSFLKTYPKWLKNDEKDDMVVLDQMVSMWAGRYTGKCKQQNRDFESMDVVERPNKEARNDHKDKGQGPLSIRPRRSSASSNASSNHPGKGDSVGS